MAKTILVVDDEKDLRDALVSALEAEGFRTLEAGDGEEGLTLALAHKPDLILLDVIMPKLDGMGMLERLRADDWGKRANVMLLTALGDMETISKAIEQGGHDYFVKTDWQLSDIIKKIREKLG